MMKQFVELVRRLREGGDGSQAGVLMIEAYFVEADLLLVDEQADDGQ